MDAMRVCAPTHLTAWDPVAGRQRWRVEHDSQVPGGVLATAGDLVFQGGGDGFLRAFDAVTGAKLWSFETKVGVMAPPVSYAVDGEQYVAVLAGLGGSHGLHRDVLRYENDGRILAFKLGGKAEMPAVRLRDPGRIDPPPLALTEAKVERGRQLYGRHCARCHGLTTRSTGILPDLKRSKRSVHEAWQQIVLGGALAGGGMPNFSDVLQANDVDDIHAYVVARALHEPTLLEELALWASQHACVPAEWVAD
jgi:quinohemoprotein ethanol dehydrogenase